MLSFRIREILFGNWRNKGVALFFAAIIWLVAFQSETQNDSIVVRVIPAARGEGQIIIRQECLDREQKTVKLVPFDGNVTLDIVGPRKQIAKMHSEGGHEVRLQIDAGAEPGSEQKRIVLTRASFPDIPPTVNVTNIVPDAILITFDRAEEREFPIELVYQRLPEGMEAEPPRLDPPTVKVQGPRTVLDRLQVTAEAWIGAQERFEETLPLIKRHPPEIDKALVDRSVRFIGPPQVKVSVRLRYKNDTFDADAVRVRFLVPAAKSPFRIKFDDDTIRVRFQGPLAEIRRLRERVRDADFALAVRVPPPAAEGERTIAFTEDALLLYGFSDRVQILQHPFRQAQGKGAWTYSLIPVPAPAAKGSE